MKPLDRLSEYLGAIEKRLRLIALTRGIAVTAGMALALTVVAVLVINQFAFSNGSVIGARVFLFQFAKNLITQLFIGHKRGVQTGNSHVGFGKVKLNIFH